MQKTGQLHFTLMTIVLTLVLMIYAPIAGATTYSDNIVPGSGGVASTSFYRSGHIASFAFDGNYDTFWEADLRQSNSLTYVFPTPRIVTRTKVVAEPLGNVTLPNDWIFYGSNDGVTWDVLGTTNVGITADSFTDNVNNSKAYTMYRFNFTSWINPMAFGGIAEVEMFETI